MVPPSMVIYKQQYCKQHIAARQQGTTTATDGMTTGHNNFDVRHDNRDGWHTMATGGTTTRHDNGKGWQGDRRHDDFNGRQGAAGQQAAQQRQ